MHPHRGRATSLFEPTGSQRDPASVIFNLPDHRVVDAVDLPLGGRRVKAQRVDLEAGCPDCGVVSVRVHTWTEQRVQDLPPAGRVVVIDASAAFRKAIVDALPHAQISADPFHLVQLANLVVTRVRQRLVQHREQRRGRTLDPAWAHRMITPEAPKNASRARVKSKPADALTGSRRPLP